MNMKSILMAAVMTVSVLAGSAHAVQEGGCIPERPIKPKPIIQDPQAAAPAAAQELPECDMLPNCKR